MRFFTLSLTACLLLVGCGPRSKSNLSPADAKLRGTLTGTWMRESNGATQGTIHLAADGTFVAAWTNFHAKPLRAWTYEGKWEVTNGAISCTLTKSGAVNTTNSEAVGSVDLFRIIRLDDNNLVWENSGQINSLTRRN